MGFTTTTRGNPRDVDGDVVFDGTLSTGRCGGVALWGELDTIVGIVVLVPDALADL